MRQLPRGPLAVLLGATLLSVSGDGIAQVGVPWLVLLTTGSAAKAGIVALCTLLPAAVSSLAGGTLVDRAGARSVSVLSDVACCATVAAIPVLQLAGVLRFWELCALMAATGLLNAPGTTARAVILPALARDSGMPLARAAGVYGGAARAASMIGSAAGGVLIAALGPAHALFIDAGSFAGSAVLVMAGIRRPEPGRARPAGRAPRPGRGYRRDLRDGVRLVVATPLLLGITLLTLAERLPRWPVYTLGFIIVGMPRFAVAALTATPAPLITMMAIEGIACGPLSPIIASITYQLTPEHMRGRAIGTMTATALAATPFGALAAGTLIDSLGLPASTAIFGVTYLLVTAIPAAIPLYRQMSEQPGPGAARTGQLTGPAPESARPSRAARRQR